jgi:hypothetical protein
MRALPLHDFYLLQDGVPVWPGMGHRHLYNR